MSKVSEIIESLPTFVVPIDIRSIVACSDPAYAERRQHFIDRVYSLQTEINAENERLNVDNIEALNTKREAIVIKLKAARAAFDELMSQQAYFEASERSLSKIVTDTSFAVQLKKDSPPQPAYASNADIMQWNNELAALQSAANTATTNLYNHQNLMTFWTADCRKAKAAHDALAVEELEIRNHLNRLRKALSPQPTSIGLSA